uniref:Cell morphogenesis protein N-terminal domain-containing protein n=1 Tax=Ditylenchus dipsaci TaxID=166011 RepID=A0A915EWX1_9BILA
MVQKKFVSELNELRKENPFTSTTVRNIISLLMGMKFFRIKTQTYLDFEMGVNFLDELGSYFLEVDLKQKDLKHALAGLLVEILLPVAAQIKTEANIPALIAFVEKLYGPTYDLVNKKQHKMKIAMSGSPASKRSRRTNKLLVLSMMKLWLGRASSLVASSTRYSILEAYRKSRLQKSSMSWDSQLKSGENLIYHIELHVENEPASHTNMNHTLLKFIITSGKSVHLMGYQIYIEFLNSFRKLSAEAEKAGSKKTAKDFLPSRKTMSKRIDDKLEGV